MYKNTKNKSCNDRLEFADELNIPNALHPKQTGSVSQNTSKPISKKNKKPK
ncbi:hypothetical protein [Tepidibacter mesophilus]|uniref:hypothetical protein n=1 Tax=Tepidibacter mesophilus TaxID=655607 RepID=UPI001650F202|nr:hypothetical protein [Tepidibacter mesophilus]